MIPFVRALASAQLCPQKTPRLGPRSSPLALAAAAAAAAATKNTHLDQRSLDRTMRRALAHQPALLPSNIGPETEHDAFDVPRYLTL